MLLVRLYAPLRTQEAERQRFDAALAAFTHALDLQRPTLLLGDFNGNIGGRDPCPLLVQLTGPGGAWVDLQQVFASHPLEPTYHSVATSRCSSGSSRIDFILASRSALPLVRHAAVFSHIRDGGHCPLVATLHLSQPLPIVWQRPRPQLPALLRLSSAELRTSPDFKALLER